MSLTNPNSNSLLKQGGCVRTLLTTTCGSHAHGTATPASDVDERSIFLQPTSAILALGREGYEKFLKHPDRDVNAWELGHFLHLCMKGSPATLEALLVKPELTTEEGEELRALFPHLLARKAIWGCFGGFARSERKTFLSPNSRRTTKSMGHFLRTLYNGIELLATGTMTVRIVDTPIGETVMAAKLGRLEAGEVLDIGAELERQLDAAAQASKLPDQPNLPAVNQFLLKLRRANW